VTFRVARGVAVWLACAAGALAATGAAAYPPLPALPDRAVTPGARNAEVTQANVDETICVRGWTRTVRPPLSYTNRLKHRYLARAGLPRAAIHEFELDHLIPLELGGSPADPRNLWLEPWQGEWNAHLKDDLERRLNRLVCRGEITLADAQEAIATNWVDAYRQFMTGRAAGNRRHYRRPRAH
jgi:hypothetical protein